MKSSLTISELANIIKLSRLSLGKNRNDLIKKL